MQQAHVVLGSRRPGAAVSPLIYGHFIEFIRDGISAMWAELLRNRSFEVAGRQPHEAADWSGAGVRCGGAAGPSPTALRLAAAVRQSGLCVRGGQRYRGSGWFWAPEGGATVTLRLLTGEGAAEALLAVGSAPARYEFVLTAPGSDDAAVLEIAAHGEVYLDQLSLMPEDAEDGWRHDVLELARALRPPVLRFPGGCFADAYHWRDGVGERDRRPARINHPWKHVGLELEDNAVGTAEFITLCRHLGCEPLLVINFGSAEPAEAAAWVQYCNGDATTPMGRLRAEHGHPEPFGVRYWEVGNETWGHWEIGCADPATYVERYLRFRFAMRAADPTIQILATGSNANDTDQTWNTVVADGAGADMEYLTLHYYAPQMRPEESLLPEADIAARTLAATLKLDESLSGTEQVLAERGLAGRVRLAITEWNTMYFDPTEREMSLGAAVTNATFLNLFLRHAAWVGMAHFSDMVNGWEGGLIRAEPAGAYGTPSYHTFTMYAQHDGRHSLDLAVQSPTMATPPLGHLPGRDAVPWLDAAATESADGRQRWLFAVNRSLSEPLALTVECGLALGGAEAVVLGGPDPAARNTLAQPHRLAPAALAAELQASAVRLTLPPLSVVRLALRCAENSREA